MNYIIISLKHGNENKPMFWRANDAGYTQSPFEAGVYTDSQVQADQAYYNNGYSTVAVPLEIKTLNKIGFKCGYDHEALIEWHSAQNEGGK